MSSRFIFVKAWAARKATSCLPNGLHHRHFSAIGPPKNVLFMNSLGGAALDQQIYDELNQLVPQCTTNLKFDVCSFREEDKPTNPNKQQWDWYYQHSIAKTLKWAKYHKYDGVIIGDVSLVPMAVLLNTHSLSNFGNIKITSLGEAACIVAKSQGKTFSMVIGYEHLVPTFKDNLIKYGFEDSFKAFHVLHDGERKENEEYPWDRQMILKQTQKAIREDRCGAVVLASCCDLQTCGLIQTKWPKIPIVYPEMAAMKYCEIMIDNHRNQHGTAKEKDTDDYNDVLFQNSPIGHIMGNTNIDNKSEGKTL